jgi:thermitase
MRALLLVTVWIASNVLAPFSISSTGYESIEARGVEEVLVAVLDTGIDRNHQELVGRVTAEVNFTDSPNADDLHGHGTHVAGIIAASNNNEIGIAGVAPQSKLMNVKVAGDDGTCRASTVAHGIVWATDNGAKVINISLELEAPSLELERAVDYAWRHGALIIAAAGNRAATAPSYPASYTNCIAVSAIGQTGELFALSNSGDWIDVAAPGVQVYSTLPGDRYGYESGTSSAAAYVSGLAALVFGLVADENGNGRVNDEVRGVFESGCQKIDAPGTGHGRVDVSPIREALTNGTRRQYCLSR